MNEPELKINGTYLVENDGTIQGMDIENKIYTDKLDINLSGQTPTGGYLEYENSKLKNGCLTFDEYKVTIENGEAKEVEKGSCENQSLTACDSPNFHPSPEEWFAFDASTNTITGPSNIWTSITDEKLKKTDIVIPCQIGGVVVKNIGEAALAQKGITSLVVGDSVETINQNAFAANNELSVVIIGDGVTNIDYSFPGIGIDKLKLGKNVETIGVATFVSNNLKEVIIPNSVITIGASSFCNNQIEELQLGKNVEIIDASAFAANQLKEVYIYGNNIEIMAGAFSKDSTSNPNLKTIYNNTGKSFDWGSIINGTSGYNFETGIVENEAGNVEIKKSN